MKQQWNQVIDSRDPIKSYYQPDMDAHDHTYHDMPLTWMVNEVFNDA